MAYEQTYAPTDTQRFKFGFEFQIFWVFEFWVWVWVFCESLENFEKDNLKLKEKKFFLSMDLGINFDFFFLIFKIDTQIHTQKINFFLF